MSLKHRKKNRRLKTTEKGISQTFEVIHQGLITEVSILRLQAMFNLLLLLITLSWK